MDLKTTITKDLRESFVKYKILCDNHCFIEAAAVQEIMRLQRKYLKLINN